MIQWASAPERSQAARNLVGEKLLSWPRVKIGPWFTILLVLWRIGTKNYTGKRRKAKLESAMGWKVMSRYVLHCDEASGLDGLSFVRMMWFPLGKKQRCAKCQGKTRLKLSAVTRFGSFFSWKRNHGSCSGSNFPMIQPYSAEIFQTNAQTFGYSLDISWILQFSHHFMLVNSPFLLVKSENSSPFFGLRISPQAVPCWAVPNARCDARCIWWVAWIARSAVSACWPLTLKLLRPGAGVVDGAWENPKLLD